MTTEKRTIRKYTEDFKRDAVALVTERGYTVSGVGRSLDVKPDLIRRWRNEFAKEATGNQYSSF